MILEKEILINKSIDAAWAVLGLDFGNAYKWASAVNHSEAMGDDFKGAACTERGCSTSLGNIKEQLFEFSSEKFTLAYEVIEGKPSVVEFATNTWKLHKITPDSCELHIIMNIKLSGFFGSILQPILKIKMANMGQELVEDFKYYVENGIPHPRKSKTDNKDNLKKYLTVNSLFSGICGLFMVLFSRNLNTFFNIKNEYIFPVIGANLLIFSMFVFYVSRNQISNNILVKIITTLDVFWVLGSLIIVSLGLFNLSSSGYILISLVAFWIAFLAFKQFINLKTNF